MAAIGWYEGDDRLPSYAPAGVNAGTLEPFNQFAWLYGGVIGLANGPVVWTFQWKGSTALPAWITATGDDQQFSILVNAFDSSWSPSEARGMLTVSAADADGPLANTARLALDGFAGMYGSFTWDVVEDGPPEPEAEFWTSFLASYEVP